MSLLSRFVSVFRRERVNREIDEEQEFHIASLVEELTESGMEPEEAAQQARVQFGNRTRMTAESRDARLLGVRQANTTKINGLYKTWPNPPMRSPSCAGVPFLPASGCGPPCWGEWKTNVVAFHC